MRDVVWLPRAWEDLSSRGGWHAIVWRIEGERVRPGTRGLSELRQLRRTLLNAYTGEVLDDVWLDEHGRVRSRSAPAHDTRVEPSIAASALDQAGPRVLKIAASTKMPRQRRSTPGLA